MLQNGHFNKVLLAWFQTQLTLGSETVLYSKRFTGRDFFASVHARIRARVIATHGDRDARWTRRTVADCVCDCVCVSVCASDRTATRNM